MATEAPVAVLLPFAPLKAWTQPLFSALNENRSSLKMHEELHKVFEIKKF